ncbi:MAG: Type 1 glutamine amidotransferase-like domain-containing protein [Senegalia sp. (in: firmicutes)]|uniref:Type 1 glutamine amidotransferase-like domain-containing protein n=1 Tax=Senegalia sp. (in: firmicutes) TaxID=1924098 RepID=UPI003F97998D
MIILNGGSYYPDSQEIDLYWISKVKKDELIVFIPSATTRSQEEYFEFFKQKMSQYGVFNITYADLYKDWEIARNAKVIYIAGGNTYKLLDIMRKSGFGDFLKHEAQNTMIIGNSAGAVVLGKDIRTTNDNDIIGIEDTRGLGLVDYSICPHYTEEKKDRLIKLADILKHTIIGIPEKSGFIIDKNKVSKIGFIKDFYR